MATAADLEVLPELVARLNSSLELDEVLDHAIAVCAQMTGCEGALVYLWEEERGRLVVRGALDGYRQWIDRFELEPGQGLTGWTAVTRQVGIITDEPRSDPRYLYVPDLNDERFQSVATIPVVGRRAQLIGVLTLHTHAPHEFSHDDVSLLRAIASLVAGAVENAQLHQRALWDVAVFRRLADLSRELTAASAPGKALHTLAVSVLELFQGAMVAVLRLDEPRGQLVPETWVGGDPGLRLDAVAVDGPWARLLGGEATSQSPPEALLAGTADAGSLFAAPLVLEGRPTGLLLCYARGERVLAAERQELLATVANHAAIALEADRRRAQAARRTRERELFDALRAGEQGTAGRAHAVLLVEAAPGSECERLWRSLADELGSAFPGTLTDPRPHAFAALVPVASTGWEGRLGDAVARVVGGCPQELGAGISDATEDEYPVAFRQARMAAAIARASGGDRVRAHADLGAQRHLWTISRETDPDPLERAVAGLADLDARRGSQLFRTLECYLEHQGNARRAAAALYIHRNTLRQRLKRISDLLGTDVREPSAWFDLGLAVRLVRFRPRMDTLRP